MSELSYDPFVVINNLNFKENSPPQMYDYLVSKGVKPELAREVCVLHESEVKEYLEKTLRIGVGKQKYDLGFKLKLKNDSK